MDGPQDTDLPDSGNDVKQVQTGSVSVTYAADKVGGILDFVKMVLDSYRLSPVDRF